MDLKRDIELQDLQIKDLNERYNELIKTNKLMKGIFKDSDGKGSSKRVAAFWLLVLITAHGCWCLLSCTFNNSHMDRYNDCFVVFVGPCINRKENKVLMNKITAYQINFYNCVQNLNAAAILKII
jgi:hypothetical protein